MISEWHKSYVPEKWKLMPNGKWQCTTDGKECKWAGFYYEQGAFAQVVMPCWNKQIAFYQAKVMNSASPCTDYTKMGNNIRHFYGKKRKSSQMLEFLEQMDGSH